VSGIGIVTTSYRFSRVHTLKAAYGGKMNSRDVLRSLIIASLSIC
jgi:hypothetical protein